MVPEGAGDINEGTRTQEIRSLLGLFEENPQRLHGQFFINALQRVSLQLQALQFNQVIAIDLAAGDAHRIVPNDGGDNNFVLPMVGIEPSRDLDLDDNHILNHNLAHVHGHGNGHVVAEHLFDEIIHDLDDMDDDQDDQVLYEVPDLGAHGDDGSLDDIHDNNDQVE